MSATIPETSTTGGARPAPKAGESPAVELKGVSKRFGEFNAVSDLSFTLERGEIRGFLGPNGAGKTTTIRMILDIFKPSSGEIRVLGRPSALEVRDKIGYLPEEKGLYKKMKAAAVIAFFAMLKGMPRRAARARASELLERFGLGDFADQPIDALSKGMGQKVQVLSAIAHDPEFVILDEPFSGLDPVNQQVMEDIIRDMAQRGRAVLFSTHVMEHAERLCERILLLAKGRKIFDGEVAEAKALLPRRVRIEVENDLGAAPELSGLGEMEKLDGPGKWEFRLRPGADPQAVLQICFARGIRLRGFSQHDPSLHEVFVKLVGSEAKEASFR